MQILNVKAENFKGIKLVEVAPSTDTTIVGGKNRAGKSSLLDAIAATLGGKALCPKEPIRDGEDKARCEIELTGEQKKMLPPCKVVRTWRKRKNGSVVSELEITTDEGYKAPTPQTILDSVVGPLGFDPERFLRMKPREQAEVLRGLVGLDFADLDAKLEEAYTERTAVNRRGKELKARFDAMPIHKDAPPEEVSVSALMEELTLRQGVNRNNEAVRNELAELQHGLKAWDQQIESAELDIAEFEKRLAQANDRLEDLKMKKATATGDVNAKSVEVNSLKDKDVDAVQQQIADSETVNRKVRENAERAKLDETLKQERSKSAALTKAIEDIDATKQQMREDAQWPVDGLGYDANGVTLLSRPFEQASATEQREAAFSIVAALNPSLKFAMIKDGSLLDDDSLADFARIATEKGFQLFVERVGEGKECSIVISDGEVKEWL